MDLLITRSPVPVGPTADGTTVGTCTIPTVPTHNQAVITWHTQHKNRHLDNNKTKKLTKDT